MELPLEIQMQIDLTAAAHKREIAEGFAKLRAKLTPEPAPSMASLQAFLLGAGYPNTGVGKDWGLASSQNALLQANSLSAAACGGFGRCGGLFSSYNRLF
jgi:hypothetical protein